MPTTLTTLPSASAHAAHRRASWPLLLAPLVACAADVSGSGSAPTDAIAGECPGCIPLTPACEASLTRCGAACVDLALDTANCHSCGNACTPGQVCTADGCMNLPTTCDAGCPAGSYCNAATNTCIPGCESDTNCGLGQICSANHCIVGCNASVLCPVGQVCDLGQCRAACSVDDDCPLDTVCASNTRKCEPGCTDDARCQSGEICDEDQCRAGCRADTDCAAGDVCDSGTASCRAGCRHDDACGLATVCDSASATCQPGCRSDAGCPDTQVCDGGTGQCRAGCRADAGCPRETLCNATSRMCVAGCRGDADCNAARICESGQCRAGCRNDGTCAQGGTICDAHTLLCRAGCRDDQGCEPDTHCDILAASCVAGCYGSEANCADGEACVRGENVGACGARECCTPTGCENTVGYSGCAGDFECYRGFDGATVPAAGTRCRATCEVDEDCTAGTRCTLFATGSLADLGSLRYCAKPCATDADCGRAIVMWSAQPPYGCVCREGICIEGIEWNHQECGVVDPHWGL